MQREQIHSNIEVGSILEENTFLLRRISIEPTCPSVEVDFSPVLSPSSSPLTSSPEHQLRNSFPTFNQDFSYFTPAFILQVDQEKYVSHASSYFSLHQTKKAELSVQKTELYVPKPSKLSHYCCICKAVFEDYLTHVNIPMHQQKLRSSLFNAYIAELCGKYKKIEVEVTGKKGRKQSKKISKTEKSKKNQRRNMDSLLNCNVVKLDCSEQAKTGDIVD